MKIMSNRESFLGESIRQLHAACVDAVWRKDAVNFSGLFSVDGQWKVAGNHFLGRDAIAEGFSRLLSINQRVLMQMGTPLLSFTADTVLARTYVIEKIKRQDGIGVITMGTYYESFQCTNEHCLFHFRHFDLHYYGPPDMSGAFYPIHDYGPPPAMPHIDAPTVVRL